MASLHSSIRQFPLLTSRRPPRLSPLASAVRLVLAGGFCGVVSQTALADASIASLPVPAAVLATQGRASYFQDGLKGIIDQKTDKAVLNWKSFNVGVPNTVEFRQPNASSIALNRINEQVNPSQILGTLTANGQVYLYNPNGFVFGKDSRVNVNSLVATTLNLSDEVFDRGITKVFDQEGGKAAFQWTGGVIGTDGKPVQVRPGPDGSRVTIEQGAQISTNAPNRRILIVAPTIVNGGDVRADDGEVILAAASDKLYLQEAPTDSAGSGLLVEVSKGGDVTNSGSITARRGNITLLGFAVNQNGMVSASTSVRVNGSIRLLAREGAEVTRDGDKYKLGYTSTYRTTAGSDGLGQVARVKLGAGSRTQVLPEYGDTATAVDEQSQPRSQIEIVGKQVRLESNAKVLAPSGDVIVQGTDPTAGNSTARIRDTRIDMAPGSRIDVAGLNVTKPMESNVVEVELRGNELRDAPLQRNGVLRNQKVAIDARVGTKLADVSSAIRRIGRTIEERSTDGGNITLNAPGAVVVNENVSLDVSGGSVTYQDGYIKTTQLVRQGGIVDIGKADPNTIYSGILQPLVKLYTKWNQSESWMLGLLERGRFEKGYTDGRDGGSLRIVTEALSLMGELSGKTTSGIHQREVKNLPDTASLSIDLTASTMVGQNVAFLPGKTLSTLDPDQPFQGLENGGNKPAPLVLTGDFQRKSSIGNLTIKTSGRVDLASGVNVDVPDAGSLSLTGGQLAIAGSIDAAGGAVSLATEVPISARATMNGEIRLLSGSRIDVGGVWLNELGQVGASASLINVDAGRIKASSQGDLKVERGAELAADGGAWLQSSGKLIGGKGGSIALTSTAFPGQVGSNLTLDGSVHAYALEQGGSLSLTTNEIVVTNGAESTQRPGALVPLALDSGFFGRGGFSGYSLTSDYRGVTVGSDARVRLSSENLALAPGFRRVESGRSLSAVTTHTMLPDYLRKPVDLTLAHRPPLGQLLVNSAVRVKEGAVVQADPKAHVSLISEGNIDVAGSIKAQGGTIDLTVLAPSDAEKGLEFLASQGIFLASTARLDASGTSLLKPDASGFRTGELLAGGHINLRAERGYIVTAADSRLDVSGASDQFQLAASPSYRIAHPGDQAYTTADSNGGTISLTAAEGILVDGTLSGRAGGSKATGGTLTLELDRLLRNEPSLAPFPVGDRILEMHAGTGQNAPANWSPGKNIPSALNGIGRISSATVANGGFGALSLKSNDSIRLSDGVALDLARNIVLDAPVLGWTGAAGSAGLAADYIAIGSTLSRHATRATSSGSASLNVNARLVDLVGSVSLQGYTSSRIASRGDIRLRGVAPNFDDAEVAKHYSGEFKTAGDLSLQAVQIYPTTVSNYTVNLTGANRTLRIEQGAGTAEPVLSAAGNVTLKAAHIVDGGTIKAPFGQLHFVASDSISIQEGALISVSGKGSLVPFGRTPGGLEWLYPLNAIGPSGNLRTSEQYNLVFASPPTKSIDLNAPKVALNGGSTIDISGGGDLYAFEFASGLGGSVDVLNPRDPKVLSGEYVYQEKYAVLPTMKNAYSPYDPLEFPASGLSMGQSIYLSGVDGLPAGEYALLPAHYALLPGAYLITPQKSISGIQPGQVFDRIDGAQIIAGYTKSLGTSEAPWSWSAFAVEQGSVAHTRSEYQGHLASEYFAEQASKEGVKSAASVLDAGSLTLAATSELRLGTEILAQPALGGRGGQLDIVAQNISVVSKERSGVPAPAGVIALLDEDLSRLNVASLGLGTSRIRNSDGSTRLSVNANKVTIQSGVRLKGEDIVLAAKDQVVVKGGAEIEGQGASNDSGNYVVDGDAALLRVSSGRQGGYIHKGEAGAKGDLLIEDGAVLRADGSMLLDSSHDTVIDGSLAMRAGDLTIRAGTINLGETPSGAAGAVLSDALLAGLTVDNLKLASRESINFFGSLDLHLSRLELDAGELAGYGAQGDTASVSAKSIRLSHSSGATAGISGTGHGRLSLEADGFELSDGNYAIKGFDSITLTGTNDLRFSGDSHVSLYGDTHLAGARFSGFDGGRLSLDATGHRLSFGTTVGASLASPGVGVALDAVADTIDFAASLLMPSGTASFIALQGGLNLASGADLDLSGRAYTFAGGTHVETPGGLLTLTAKQGDVNLNQGANIHLAGGGNSVRAGSLSVSAAAGSVLLNGNLDASGGGSLLVDGLSLGPDGFSGLIAKAAAGGFDDSLSVRQRAGSLIVAQSDEVKAHSVALTADAGDILVNGIIDAGGVKGGKVVLSAAEQVVLESGAKIFANSTAGKGGTVELASSKGVAAAAEDQGLVLKAGSLIDVSGNTQVLDGDVHLRAMRNADSVSIAPIASTVTGAHRVLVEAVKVESVSDFGGLPTWQGNTEDFMTHAASIGQALGSEVTIVPGLEISSEGDLTLDDSWDLSTWRYSTDPSDPESPKTIPGILTLRAAGDIVLNQPISDGFDAFNKLMEGESWSVRLVSGADRSADWRQSVHGVGDLTLSPGALVRTGTGDIEIHTGGDLILKDQTAAIYTAGRADAKDPYGTLNEIFRGAYFNVEYPIGGGDIRIVAGGDILGAKSTQFIPDWLQRMGNFNSNVSDEARTKGDVFFDGTVSEEELPTAWGIQYNFQQNVGALGGGDVYVTSGGNIDNLQVMLPTTGKQIGTINPDLPISDLTYLDRYITNEVQVNGGGNLSVTARGDIRGGQYFVDRGEADLFSWGNIAGGKPADIQFSTGPLFAIGDADFHLAAANGISVGAAYNPYALAQRSPAWVYNTTSTFFNYTDRSALHLQATAGDIDFRNDVAGVADQYFDDWRGISALSARSAQDGLRILPGTVEAVTLKGDIKLTSFNLFPNARGNLSLVAGGDIYSDPALDEVVVNMSDADPSLFPTVAAPAADLEAVTRNLLDTRNTESNSLHALKPVHAGDNTPARLISQSGSINGNNNLKVFLAKSAYVNAGQDVKDIGLNIQNLAQSDISVIEAGRDLRYHISRTFVGALKELAGFGVQIAGPGQLQVLTSRDIDLGASDGIISTGNQGDINADIKGNPALDDVGASLMLMAGLQTKPAYGTFLQDYFGETGSYRVAADGRVTYGPTADASSLGHALALPEEQQRELALLVFFNELKLSSQEAAAGNGYRRGDEAIATLFPGDKYDGDIKLFFSRIHTTDGGGIDMVVPGGLINAGLASAFVGEKKPSELGIVTQRGGAVQAYTLGDFQVNQSRVFAIASALSDFTPRFGLYDTMGTFIESYKDVVAWSATGNIDAGRGSKGALSVSNGKKGFDQNGNWTDDVPPTIDGSGVRAQIRGNLEAGNVYLAAPQGVVDAGEAGIGGNQVTIAANAIIGASNIQTGAGGLSSNVSTSTAAPVAPPASAASAATSATKSAQSVSDGGDKSGDPSKAENKQAGVSLINADVVGFGNCSVGDVRDGKAGCGGA
ncbi:filamentous haemagglutinin family protein [Methylococcus sp. EFPC2]|uniref:filamentous haemagglutinin family protein n=1 Tax=Methylococcus sp. EFPC2 TaxID=2812648 RepID=UPI0019673500|nr:filamentous haemagglutinin family protein [Methylococcus sp. EFPC2]QSA97270.1 filamentous hemagglutinin family protein [Methylococcus sp. EFPC2]